MAERSDRPQPPSNSSSETLLIGLLKANVVGIQHYNGKIKGREMVGLVREPMNPYDPNAIKVLNLRLVQVGHIERSVALVLSPLIDQQVIHIEGIVPSERQGIRKLPCQIYIFAHLSSFPFVKMTLARSRLGFISQNDPSFTFSEAMVVRKSEGKVKNVDKIFKLVRDEVTKGTKMEAREPSKEVIKSELFLHQKEGLGWLLRRESSDDLPPFWEVKDGEFVNVLTNSTTKIRPKPLCGGIYADDMGMGKTLTLLSLISCDQYGSVACSSSGNPTIDADKKQENSEEAEGFGGKISKKRVRVYQKGSRVGKKLKTDSSTQQENLHGVIGESATVMCNKKTTLIVCPPSVISTWVTELESHTVQGALKVYLFYGERTDDVEELKKYDIVLTTYSTLASDINFKHSPTRSMEWWRIILDEAHKIKNPKAGISSAVTSLKGKHRWAVTGTPIQNGSLDLFSLMIFLKFKPFCDHTCWQNLIQKPLDEGHKKGLSRLQFLMATISLRRTKDESLLGLPPKTVETCFIELSTGERELYDQLEADAKLLFQGLIDSGRVLRNYSTILSLIMRLRQICTDKSLCPSDLASSESLEDASNNPELLKKLVGVIQDGEDFECPVCMSPPADIIITICAHIFCRKCILNTIQRMQPRCPLCRHSISQSDIFTAPPESLEAGNGEAYRHSSKVSALFKMLLTSRDQNPNKKSVIFSQYRKLLLKLEEPLRASGFNFSRLDGTMGATRRHNVIQQFSKPGGPTILLASVVASGAGINLTAASTVYLVEPWWNPGVEEQAMDRVHRIGQTQEVKVVRLIARNTIDERVLKLKEKKEIAKETSRAKGSKHRRDVSLDDICTLIGM